jgi:hypothetical protein
VSQQIIADTDIVNICIDVIQSGHQYPNVLCHVLRFLRAMCLDFPQIQSHLFLSLDELLGCHANEHGWKDQAGKHIDDHSPWEQELGLLLAEMFNDNRELCLHIKTRQVRTPSMLNWTPFIRSCCWSSPLSPWLLFV